MERQPAQAGHPVPPFGPGLIHRQGRRRRRLARHPAHGRTDHWGSYDPCVSPAVLATKLFAPARRAQAVVRPRLLEQLDTTLDPGRRLTLVSAPAGFGKTTALSDWVAGLGEGQPSTRAAWLSLDDGDNDLARLLTHLLASLRRSASTSTLRRSSSPCQATRAAALTALVNAVASAAEHSPGVQWILVLDDYHVIAAPDVHEAMSFLLDHLPDQLHLVMATRADPPLPLARLRSRGQLVEVRGADLRFTPCEAQQFLNQAMGLDLAAADVDALEERTEGWIAGLQLAALSLRAIPSRPRSWTSSRRSPAATGSSSTTWPTRSWPGSRHRCATSCCAPPSSTGSPVPCVTRSPGSPAEPRGWWSSSGQPVPRPAGHRALLVPLPPPVRRRPARTPAHRGPLTGPAAAPAGQRLVCRARPGR